MRSPKCIGDKPIVWARNAQDSSRMLAVGHGGGEPVANHAGRAARNEPHDARPMISHR
jgi:hypothetical protein